MQCDFIGPLKKAGDGSKYIMTFIDLLTGWPEAFCTKDSTAATAAKVFLHEIVCRYGRVERLHTDRGACLICLGKSLLEWHANKRSPLGECPQGTRE